jgi:hypothetical protein
MAVTHTKARGLAGETTRKNVHWLCRRLPHTCAGGELEIS